MLIPSLLKKIVCIVFIITFYCEIVIYYIVLLQCSWPSIDSIQYFKYNNKNSYQPLKVLLLADTHLLGSKKGHWFDKLRREWQMYRAFQTAIFIHNPDVVFVLGDLFDEGLWSSKSEFKYYVKRFHRLFYVPDKTKLYVVPGNHDMGFHYWIIGYPYLKQRFEKTFNITSVEMLTLQGNTFILMNSMAMEGDKCFFCKEAVQKLIRISNTLYCQKNENSSEFCDSIEILEEYSRPIFLQHFPMYRPSEKICNEPDGAPSDEKSKSYREKWDCLSKEATDNILNLLNPRVIFTGHTHYGCHTIHRTDIHEWTLSSFSWRNTNNPSFILAVFTPDNYDINKCYMPQENTVIWIYIIGLIFILFFIFYYKNVKFLQKCIKFSKD